jgi:hypothetical protein
MMAVEERAKALPKADEEIEKARAKAIEGKCSPERVWS